MKKILITLVATLFIAFGYTPGAFAAGPDSWMSSDVKDSHADSTDILAWIGNDVKNPQGEDLGYVNGFIRDENGEISFVFVSHNERNVAVPYSALSFDEEHVVLDATRDQLANAPEIGTDENLTDLALAEEAYRHFGERPAWTEKGGAADQSIPDEYFGFSRDDALKHIGPDMDIDIPERLGLDQGM